MRELSSLATLTTLAFCLSACSLAAPTAAGPSLAMRDDGQIASPQSTPPAQLYPSAVGDLIAATQVRSSQLKATLTELERCKFVISVSPGMQSILETSFDVRQLNLDTFSESEGQSMEGEFVARMFSCSADHRGCVSKTGARADTLTIYSPNAEGFERARDALRRTQSACLREPA